LEQGAAGDGRNNAFHGFRSRRQSCSTDGRRGDRRNAVVRNAPGAEAGELIGAEAVLLQAPGIVSSVQARRVLCRDISVRLASDLFPKITLALVGIGSMEPSPFLVNSGNSFSPAERRQIYRQGAVGDLCLRFFDRLGKPIKSTLNSRVIGIELETSSKWSV